MNICWKGIIYGKWKSLYKVIIDTVKSLSETQDPDNKEMSNLKKIIQIYVTKENPNPGIKFWDKIQEYLLKNYKFLKNLQVLMRY